MRVAFVSFYSLNWHLKEASCAVSVIVFGLEHAKDCSHVTLPEFMMMV